MPRPTTKPDMISSAISNYETLTTLISRLTEKELIASFNFGDNQKKEAHWSRDKNLRDVLVHLYEWHQLLLNWICSNKNGDKKPFLPLPYNWKTYGDMNVEFWQKHQDTSLETALGLLRQSHEEVLNLAQSFSNDELFSKNTYPWVGGSTLGSYFVSATSSHYGWAIKKLKAHKKNCSRKELC